MADRSNLANDEDTMHGGQPDGQPDGQPGGPGLRRRRILRVAMAGAGMVALALGATWGMRERIASDLIDRELTALHLPAQYRIDAVGVGREVLSAVVVGDPAHPDLVIERAEIALRYGHAGPEIDRITLIRPRLYGRLIAGRVSLGSLDPLIYAPTTSPLRLPDWSLTLVDARGRVDSGYGALAFSIDGAGRLSDGFAGKVGALVSQAQLNPHCALARTTLYAAVSTRGGLVHVAGPLRLGGGQCGTTRMAPGKVDLTLGGDATLTDWTLGGHLALGRIDSGKTLTLAGLGGETGLHWQAGQGDLAGRVTLNATGIAAPAMRLGSLRLDGMVHARQNRAGSGFGLDFRGDIDGRSLARGPAALVALGQAQARARGTPIGSLLDRAAAALAREEPGDHLAGSIGVHSDAAGWRIAVPSLALRGGHNGQTLASLDQIAVTYASDGIPRLTGNFKTGGADIPVITGTMQSDGRGGPGGAHFNLAMARYSAADAQLAVPAMAVTQLGNGALTFAGLVALGGPVGTGRIDNLVLPVEGGVATDGQVSLLHHCTRPTFDRLRVGSLDLTRGAITLCPSDGVGGGAIVQTNGHTFRVAAALPAFGLSGRSGDAPLAIHAGGARIAWPGTSTMSAVDVVLGKSDTANHVHLASVMVATGSGGALGGTFTGGDVTIAAMPVTLGAAAGDWVLNGGRMTLGGGAFTVTDTANPARFAPIGVRNVTMTLAGNGAAAEAGDRIDAQAQVVAPRPNGQPSVNLANIALHHDLGSGKGHADVTLTGLTFRNPAAKDFAREKAIALQPGDLSMLAKGVIANANGTIQGKARFDWNTTVPGGGVTSSGRFSSDDFDFAAAVGPVEGLSGTVEFTDLIHLVTAPHQVLKIASINPGIEVVGGTVDLELRKGDVLQLNHAQWPFEGGTLQLEPVELHLGSADPYKFTLAITGLEAGRFLQHINMSNLSATGLFDGRLPLIFDANGGRIAGGQLISRPPGGNVSYVGALSYRDLSPMANYAFRMLRSVDYSTMTIGLDGDLAGEVVTRVNFGGIHQGKGAQINLITRQLSKLPVQFNINIRAQFYQLLGSLRSLYDPTLVRDPRELGLVDAQGRPVHQHHGQVTVEPVATKPGPATPGVSASPKPGAIQPQASGTMP